MHHARESLLGSKRIADKRRLLISAAVIFTTLILAVLLLIGLLGGDEEFEWPPPSPSVMGAFDRFAITTDHTLCAHAGKSIIDAGGNAAEAAVAAMFCLGAVNPQSSGLGGGFLMTLYNASTGRCTAIDARESAPGLSNHTMFVNNTEAGKYGHLAAAVPGELAGYWEVYRRFGSGAVKWAQLVQPTIDLIEAGVPVSAYLVKVMKDFEPKFRRTPSMKLYINPETNDTYKEGDRMPRERLLRTLKKIAAAPDPVKLFYQGEFAEVIDREMRTNGGIIRKEDLAAYRVRVLETALVAQFKNGLAICGGPPPSGFAVAQLIINLMNHLYPNATVHQLRSDPKVYHHLIESQKFAYALRSQLGDEEFVLSAGKIAKRMLTPEFIASVLGKITDISHETAYYGADDTAASADFGTSHVSALDGDGNGVSATTTINRRFGASVESEELGILWNDEMGDFSTPGVNNVYGYAPSEANFIAPGKRPMSSMSPLVVYGQDDRKVHMVAGASGGSRIISAVAKAEAIDAPSVHNQFTPDITQADRDFPMELKSILEKQHDQKFPSSSGFSGIVQAVHVNSEGKINACGDARRNTDQTAAGV